MHEPTAEALFARFRDHADADALAAVFDRLAPKLLLVAAHLAGGDVAEDLVQATFLDAMRQRRRWDASRPFAPWLIGLLGNHVREARRQRRRVPDPHRLASRTVESPVTNAEADECFAAVASAVDALPRHYRQVLSLRLVHGLELQQIAHSLDVPLGTVKVRLHRGLALLRRALPAGLTASLAMIATPSLGLAAARQAVLGEAALATSGAVAGIAFVLGGLGMNKLVLGAAAAALAVAGWFAFAPRDAAPGTAPPAANAPAVVAATSVPGEPAASSSSPTAIAADATPRAPERREAATTGSLVVETVWDDGAPAPFLTLHACGDERPAPISTGDANGRTTFGALAPGDYTILVAGLTHDQKKSRVDVRAGEAAALRIVVGGGLRLRVTVVDTEGAPKRGASVWVGDRYRVDETYRNAGVTDAAGELSWRGVPVREVFARRVGCEPSAAHELPQFDVVGAPREPIAVRLTVTPIACTVLGTVVDPQGRAAAGARVVIACDDAIRETRRELRVEADAQGRFQCDEVPAGERNIAASLPGLARAIARITTSVREPTTVHLQLRTGATLSGCIRDADGKPLAGVQVSTRSGPHLVGLQSQCDAMESRSDADGRYEVRAIPTPGFTAYVDVEPRIQKPFSAEDGQHITWDPVREPERAITGIVVDAENKPLASWRVSAMPPPQPLRHTPPRQARTKADGGFRIDGLEDVPHRLFLFTPLTDTNRLSAAASVSCVVLDDVRPAAEPRTIRVPAEAMPTAWLEGSLTLPEGLQAQAELSLSPTAMLGGGYTVPQQRLESGATTFRIGPLPPGEYGVTCYIQGRGPLYHPGLRLVTNETTRVPPFAFDAQRPCVVALHLVDGRPATGGVVKLKSSGTPCLETAPGRYESQPVSEGADELVVRGPDFAPATFPITRSATAANELAVRAAATVTVRLTPPTPRDRWVDAAFVRITDAAGAEVVNDLVQVDGASDFRWSLGLAPGTYSLTFRRVGGSEAQTTATVATEPVQLELAFTK